MKTYLVPSCKKCGKYHLLAYPCKDSRKPGEPQSRTHGIQAVMSHIRQGKVSG